MGNTSSSSNSTNIFHPSTSQQQHQQHQNSDKMNSNNSRQLATFAAGCFWGVEKSFARKFKTFGIVSKVGYIGGKAGNPSYKQVCTGSTGHAEAIQISYDPATLDYKTLVDFFYRMHDPTTLNRQGNDAGSQYRSAIFYHSEEQRIIAESVTAEVKPIFKTVATTIEEAGQWFDAEDYHQDYLTKNPHGYECSTHFERSWDQIKKQYSSTL